MHLHEWQQHLQNGILHSDSQTAVLEQYLLQGFVEKHTQLDIYAYAYVARLNEALRTNYPALHQLLGDEEFDVMATAYLQQYPPCHASIRWYGEALGVFLLRRSPYNDLPVFACLARFEWALRHTIDAADGHRITAEFMAALAPEQWGDWCFNLHPAAQLVELQWNAPVILKALMEEGEVPSPQPQPQHWLVYRQTDLISGWRAIGELECVALQCLQQGGTFADICEAIALLVDGQDSAAAHAAGLLRVWIAQGLIVHR